MTNSLTARYEINGKFHQFGVVSPVWRQPLATAAAPEAKLLASLASDLQHSEQDYSAIDTSVICASVATTSYAKMSKQVCEPAKYHREFS